MANEPAKAPRTFLDLLEQSRPEIAKLLPDPKQVDRVVRIVRSAWQSDEKIRACEPMSILSSVMKACELDLEPGGAQKHAYLVPYGKERPVCQLIVGYAGFLKLVRDSDKVDTIGTRAVREKDDFDYSFTPEPRIDHKPFLGSEPGPTTHVYAYLRLKGSGYLSAEVMTFDEVEHVRKSSKAGNVWGTYWDEMARKTVLKRMLKTQELTPKVARAIEHDNGTTGLPALQAPQVGRGRLGGTEGLIEHLQITSKPPEASEPPPSAE